MISTTVVAASTEALSLQPGLEILVKATCVLLATAGLVACLRSSSAATRHLVWTSGILAALAMPLLVAVLPSWRVPLASRLIPDGRALVATTPVSAARARPTRATATRSTPRTPGEVSATAAPRRSAGTLPVAPLLAGAWLAGSLVLLVRLLRGLLRAGRIVRDGTALDAGELAPLKVTLGVRRQVRLVSSPDVRVPMTCGLREPAIVVPPGFAGWGAQCRRAVLLHELAHVKRLDWLAQVVARLATSTYWFHPLAWLAERRLRRDAELAADDLVLAAGTRPSSYAAQLVAVLRSVGPGRPAGAHVVSMAGSAVEGRVTAILDPGRARGAASGRAVLCVLAILVATASLVASASLTTDEQPAPQSRLADGRLASLRAAPEPRAAWAPAEPERIRTDEPSILPPAPRARPKRAERTLTQGWTPRWTPGENDEPDSGKDWYRLGYRHHDRGEYEQAITAFRRARESGYRASASAYNIACGHALMRDEGEAYRWLEIAADEGFDLLDYLTSDDDLRVLRGTERFRELVRYHRDDRHLASLEKRLAHLREKHPRDEGGKWHSLGMDFHRAGAHRRAEDAWRQAAATGFRQSTATYNVACALAQQERMDAALDELETAIELGFSNTELLASDADLDPLRDEPRFHELIQRVEALSTPKRNWYGLGGPDWPASVDRLEALVVETPHGGYAWFQLGYALLQVDEPERAAPAFVRAHELGFQPGKSAFNAACALARDGEPDGAFEWLDRAVDSGFKNFEAMREDSDLASLRDDPRFERVTRAERTAPPASPAERYY